MSVRRLVKLWLRDVAASFVAVAFVFLGRRQSRFEETASSFSWRVEILILDKILFEAYEEGGIH